MSLIFLNLLQISLVDAWICGVVINFELFKNFFLLII